jgi:hypothetical protein
MRIYYKKVKKNTIGIHDEFKKTVGDLGARLRDEGPRETLVVLFEYSGL